MQYRTMPKTGDRLSVLGFGAMRLPRKRGRIDEGRATRQVRGTVDAGVNGIDTATPYHMGASQPFPGRALSGGHRERVHPATKQPPGAARTRAEKQAGKGA